ncbi:hypothetical protein NSA50_05290 [Clostridium sp. DSM 100503]|uniref:hypothetical protein n=1 Tax=Clostridium sp. DSM 100503 TaxID=2963282 RepID=UPI002149B1DE|nr:hypothetical protein [Clostridium sp. DSM 100503]MCR1950477.1 hypothetical protein [Clostridium sp. DSM 100503]
MNSILIFSGIWIAILPKMNWYSVEIKKLNIAYYFIGVYTLILGILSNMIDVNIKDGLFIILLSAVIVLEICTIILRVKGEKNTIDILAIVTSIILLILATSLALIEIKELQWAIAIIIGALLLLSVSFKKLDKNN